jgi:hypothetical protein
MHVGEATRVLFRAEGIRVSKLTDSGPSFGKSARLGRKSRRRLIWRTRAPLRRRPSRGSRTREKSVGKKTPNQAGEVWTSRRLSYLLEGVGIDVAVEIGETGRAGGAIFRLRKGLLVGLKIGW